MDANKIVMQQIQQLNLDRAETLSKCSMLYQHCLAQGTIIKWISRKRLYARCVVLITHTDQTPAQLRLNLMKQISAAGHSNPFVQGDVQQ